MRLDELDFELPGDLIAQRPMEPRDACRLMHMKEDGSRAHLVFSQLPDILRPGDTLVFNDSRVLPARMEAHKITGAAVEVLFLRPCDSASGLGEGAGISKVPAGETWEVLARPSHRLRPGQELVLIDGHEIAGVKKE